MNLVSLTEYKYKVGGSLNFNDPTYVIRQADKTLLEALKLGKFCYVFNCRQMGKSSLRVRAMHQLQAEGMNCVSIDITSIGSNVSLQQWYGGIIVQLFRGFNLAGKTTLNLKGWLREREQLSPVQRLSQFIEEILLVYCPGEKIFIFIDEIDKVLSLNFSLDDFFALIRFCYNQRAENPEYERLVFALFGVATPSDLIQDKTQTSFNIGQPIELSGFRAEEAQPLAEGLTAADNPQAVLKEILAWTGGQPFLTQKLCQLVVSSCSLIPVGKEAVVVENLVQSQVILNWESQDEPVHLKTIRDRLLDNEQRTGRLLGLYRQILQQGEIAANNTPEQTQLRLSGIVVKQEGRLRVYNPIYREVFDRHWINKEFEKLRPYAEAIQAWEASWRHDESRLLRGQALRDARIWAANKSLSVQDYQFLDASQELDKRMALAAERTALRLEKLETQLTGERRAKEAAEHARRILAADYRKAKWMLRVGSIIIALSLVGVLGAGIRLHYAYQKQREVQAEALEWAGRSALKQFEFRQIEALLTAMETGQTLIQLTEEGYQIPANSLPASLIALQEILNNIREKNQLAGHEETVNSVSFSPDGKLLATASRDGTAKLWNLQGQELTTFKGHQGDVYNVNFSPDGNLLATASKDGTAKLWNLQGQELTTFKGHQGDVYNVNFSPDGKLLATASRDGTVKLWNLQGQELTTFKGHQGDVYDVSFSPDSKLLATASRDGTVKLWNLQEKTAIALKGHQATVNSISFSPDGKLLATASSDETIKLWDFQGREVTAFRGHQGAIYDVSFSPDGKLLATASSDETIKLWNLQGKELTTLRGDRGVVYDVSFSPDGKLLATASNEKVARLWDFERNPLAMEKISFQDRIANRSFSPNGQKLATAFANGIVRLEDLQGHRLLEFKAHQDTVYSVSFSPNGQKLATASQNGTVRLWNLRGKKLAEFKGHQDIIYSVRFSPNDKLLATASRDGTAKLWNLEGEALTTFKGHQGAIYDLSFSPGGQTLSTASEDETIKLWNLQGKALTTFKGHRGAVYDVGFSPDGQLLASTSRDGTARVWNLQGEEQMAFSGYGSSVYSLTFSPDGQLLATGSTDGTVRVWDLQQNLRSEFQGHQSLVYSLNFSNDGKLLTTAGNDGDPKIWQVDASAIDKIEQLLEQGCYWLKDYLATHPKQEWPRGCHTN